MAERPGSVKRPHRWRTDVYYAILMQNASHASRDNEDAMQSLNSATRLHPGERAPDATVRGPEGPVRLGSLWLDQPVVLTFLRHYG